MKGLMMDYPLTLTQFFERSRRVFAAKRLATRVPGAPPFRYTYGEFADRVMRLAGALQGLGINRGDRVGTLAWNSHRHLEVYWAAPLLGSVLHTVNIRLSHADLTYIINHAEDSILFVDLSLWPQLEPVRKELKSLRHIVIMPDAPGMAAPPGLLDYEALLKGAKPVAAWPQLDERDAAGMCYTSGTTGHPKGVVYSHRAIYLHSMAQAMTDTFGISEKDVLFHVVPMFHANAWCVPYTGVIVGATQIFAGPNPQPRDIVEIVHKEKVTFVGGVPTIWFGVQAVLEQEPAFDISSIRCIPIGGSAAPKSLLETYEKKFGVRMTHAWGMTETTPVGTVSRLKGYMESWPDEQRLAMRAKQGYAAAGVDLRAVDEEGREVPWDGKTMGELQVRGPWIVSGYYRNPEAAKAFTADGWFRTGDVVTVDSEGYIQIMDRTKDLIKSGGEWISSVDLESLLMAHPKVLEAAVIAVAHPKWVERPLACVVPKPDQKASLTAEEVLEFLRPQVAKWWLPDEVVFLESIPKTTVGKFDKKVLRDQFKARALKA
ncbi:MAG: long-chain fatty acid--CoA ligase [Candidatus Methylomirabilia bacterium]